MLRREKDGGVAFNVTPITYKPAALSVNIPESCSAEIALAELV
jgi:hypothetical protein